MVGDGRMPPAPCATDCNQNCIAQLGWMDVVNGGSKGGMELRRLSVQGLERMLALSKCLCMLIMHDAAAVHVFVCGRGAAWPPQWPQQHS